MGEVLSKKDAYRLCYLMWQELFEFPEKDKYQTMVARNYNLNIDCAACEYHKQHPEESACGANCIMGRLWPHGCLPTKDSVFKHWGNVGDKNNLIVKKYNAGLIATYAYLMYVSLGGV